MPSADEILAGLRTITNDWRLLSMLWHGYFAVLVLGLVLGMRPTRRLAGILLALPLFSVSILAWVHDNPFNGASFALTGIVLLVIAARLKREEVQVAPYWLSAPGAVMIGFGWIYPHFLDNAVPVEYLYAAPTGLIPCPTLSIVIGFTLTLHGLQSRPWCVVLSTLGLFYGIFGAIYLGVQIDWILSLSALITAYAAFPPRMMGNRYGPAAR